MNGNKTFFYILFFLTPIFLMGQENTTNANTNRPDSYIKPQTSILYQYDTVNPKAKITEKKVSTNQQAAEASLQNKKSQKKNRTNSHFTHTKISKIPEFHIIKKGENKFRLSLKYGIPIAVIDSLNPVTAKTFLVGAKLRLKKTMLSGQSDEITQKKGIPAVDSSIATLTIPNPDVTKQPEADTTQKHTKKASKTAESKKISFIEKTRNALDFKNIELPSQLDWFTNLLGAIPFSGIEFLLNIVFFIYTIFAVGSYVILAIISAFESREYIQKNNSVNYTEIVSSDIAPHISIIAPAYNESLNIIENVRSLLSGFYVNYDVIIVNDGSKDDTLEKLIEAYDLAPVNHQINYHIATKPLRRGVFKSTNPAFEKLIVVDKENGGKADALNMGINMSHNQYVACIDVDCLLMEDALQKMVKPFLEHTDTKVIASGGVIRIANACVIKDGRLIDINLPKSLLELCQIIEYIRAFLLGRMGWSRLNDLLIISGAFGMFDRKLAIEVGGYDTKTVGEDMEIVVRMRMHMIEKKEKHKVVFIPDPLCWTEAPNNYKIFFSQRNRWARGTIEVLKKHRKLFFNSEYKNLGMISYPYHLFFERLAPVVEFVGLIYLIFLVFTDRLKWEYSMAFILMAYFFSVMFSLMGIVAEELTYHQYEKKGMGVKLALYAFLEPLLYHPIVLYSSLRGNWDYYFNKKKKWGVMTRQGMGQPSTPTK